MQDTERTTSYRPTSTDGVAVCSADDSIIPRLRSKYHVVVTVDGSVYAQWQVRVCYFHFKKLKKAAPNSDAGGFTRLLHR